MTLVASFPSKGSHSLIDRKQRTLASPFLNPVGSCVWGNEVSNEQVFPDFLFFFFIGGPSCGMMCN